MPGYSLPRYAYRRPPELSGARKGAKSERALQPYPVIVVGAGLGGLTAALELASRGVQVVVLDDDDSVGAAGLSSRGICYAKRSLEILERFGVAARVLAKGVTWNEGDVFRGEERLYRFNLQPETDQRFPAFVNLQQFYVEQYLVEALARTPSADLRWKNKVLDLRPNNNHVEVKVRTPEGTYTARCRYLVAADGAHSIVRRKLKARDAESALYDTAWCIADVKLRSNEAAVRKAYLDNPLNDGGAIWYHQMADGVWRTDWQISHYADPDAEATPARAKRRLRKLLGPKARFDLVWVGPWRFRRRWLEKMVHGRVVFLGDAAAQHSPFGARGGNRAIQDANNLGWKLAMVLSGEAHPDLLHSYELERHRAAREAVEIASRSALFIGPESGGQRLFRDAVLDLAQRYPWARALVNVGRLSTASIYADSPLNAADADIDAPLAAPGMAAPDGRLDKGGYLVEHLQGRFSVVYFGRRGPEPGLPAVRTLHVKAGRATAPLFRRYGVPKEGATYVFRPDGHVLARCRGIGGKFARVAIGNVSKFRKGIAAKGARKSPATEDRDSLYDLFSACYDDAPASEREQTLARLVVALSHSLPVSEVTEIATASNPPRRLDARPRLRQE
jgi:3-(3-hydroxy-phenyl)propionate hydroxylase